MSKEDLRKMIINNQWKEVFKALHEITWPDSVLSQEVGIIETTFNDFKRKENTGQLSHQEQTQRKSQLASSLLSIVDQLQDDGTITQKVEASPKTQQSTKKLEAEPMNPKVNILYWIAGGVGLILIFFTAQSLLFQPAPPDFQKVVINLYGPKGISDNPLSKGVVSIEAVEADFRDQSFLGTDGRAIFDSIPTALLGKKMVFSLSSSPDYVLKNPDEEYILAEKINVALKKVAPRTSQGTTTTAITCPTTGPNNLPLGSDKPPGFRRGSTAIAGYYRLENGECKWIPGHWQKNDISDCPSQPPSGINNTPAPRSGYTWISGHYLKENGRCEWVSGYWQVQSIPPERADNCPSQPPSGINNTPAPRSGYTWVKGYYSKENGRCRWIDGRWTVQVPPTRRN